MSLTSLSQVIGNIQTHTNWQQQRRFLRILEHWSNIVGDSVAAQTRPTGVYREVLQVAVSTSVWSQALMFERLRILEKLHPLIAGMGEPIQDIHFSTAKWRSTLKKSSSYQPDSQHPSSIEIATKKPQAIEKPKDALEAFDRWAKMIGSNTASLPKCPMCKCPTPPGELARWQMCRACAAVKLFK